MQCFGNSEPVNVRSKSIILKDHISGHKINIPMRGKNCDHWNVIDLENYLQLYSTLS